MKRYFTFILGIIFSSVIQAQQVFDVVETGPDYANQVWYSLQNGAVQSAPNNTWDLAFEISGFSSSIRYNAQKGLLLYPAPYAVSEWQSVDIDAVESWPVLYDDPQSWQRGALNQHLTSELDLGWGFYNMITHVVTGDSIYVIKFADNSFKKLRIDQLAQGIYTFTHANIDGSEEVTVQLNKSDFIGKNFGYYRFDENEIFDREPASDTWDITFTRYMDIVDMGEPTYYPVTGVLHNYNIISAEAANTPVDEANPNNFTFEFNINTIGYDWKSFNGTNYDLAENHSFFLQDTTGGAIYQIVFTGFGGSANGSYEFTISQHGTSGITDIEEPEFLLFPNPSNGQNVQLQWENASFTTLSVFDVTGKLILQNNLNQNSRSNSFEIPALPSGTYIISLQGPTAVTTQKLIINN